MAYEHGHGQICRIPGLRRKRDDKAKLQAPPFMAVRNLPDLLFLLLGIAGSIDHGAPLSTAWYAVPEVLIMLITSLKIEKKH